MCMGLIALILVVSVIVVRKNRNVSCVRTYQIEHERYARARAKIFMTKSL